MAPAILTTLVTEGIEIVREVMSAIEAAHAGQLTEEQAKDKIEQLHAMRLAHQAKSDALGKKLVDDAAEPT